ncbi:MAG: TlpA disulfide reductase family protein [Streptosporangiaceae bacterium]
MLKLKRRTAVIVAVAGAVLVAGVLTAVTWSGGGTSTQDVSYIDGSTSALYYAAGHRKLAPDFTGTTLTGSELTLSKYRDGDVLVLNFWGSWCVPCREETPMLAAMAATDAKEGKKIKFLGVDEQETPANAEAFDSSFGVQYPSINDSGAEVTLDFSPVVPISATPTTLVIDSTGRVAGAIFGGSSYAELSALLDRITE